MSKHDAWNEIPAVLGAGASMPPEGLEDLEDAPECQEGHDPCEGCGVCRRCGVCTRCLVRLPVTDELGRVTRVETSLEVANQWDDRFWRGVTP